MSASGVDHASVLMESSRFAWLMVILLSYENGVDFCIECAPSHSRTVGSLELTRVVRDARSRMQTSHLLRVLTIAAGLSAAAAPYAYADTVMKATDWLGHVVTTRDGKELGTVRDFGIDAHSGKVVFVVVSVGSFLIENNLIAVAPDALVRTRGDAGVLLLDADTNNLKDAQRFASDSKWPTAPDVLAFRKRARCRCRTDG